MQQQRSPLVQVMQVAAPLALAAASLHSLAGLAEPLVPRSAVRAINLARTTAIAQNGGLSRYRPAQCMFQTADRNNPCLINSPEDNNSNNNSNNRGTNRNNNNDNNYVFRFSGGSPGWQQNNQKPTLETEISVSPDGRRVVEVIYNGQPR